jgi:DNA-binding NarL/FixJ family response regulator
MGHSVMSLTDRHILLIDDHPIFRSGVRLTIERALTSVQVREASSVGEALEVLGQTSTFDLIVYDWHLRGDRRVNGLLAVTRAAPGVPLLVISTDEDEAVRVAALALGAVDCISEAAESAAISDLLRLWSSRRPNSAAQGSESAHALFRKSAIALTLRQQQVLALMARGDANKRIADQLHVAETTVRAHVSDILHLLNARNRTEAVMVAARTGLLDGPYPTVHPSAPGASP